MKCKDCKYWDNYPYSSDQHKECSNMKFINSWSNSEDIKNKNDILIYWGYDGWGEGFATGPDFGCIHFSKEDQL